MDLHLIDPRSSRTLIGYWPHHDAAFLPPDRAGMWNLVSGDCQPCSRFLQTQWQLQDYFNEEDTVRFWGQLLNARLTYFFFRVDLFVLLEDTGK